MPASASSCSKIATSTWPAGWRAGQTVVLSKVGRDYQLAGGTLQVVGLSVASRLSRPPASR
jgi:hypothetical protein